MDEVEKEHVLKEKSICGRKGRLKNCMEDSKKVSIVLPTHNGAKYIRKSIDSCLSQTYRNLELIIIDNGSTDATPEIVKSYSDPRLMYIRIDKNLGLAEGLNQGFSRAKGEYLTWTSDDNYYTPNAIKTMANALDSNADIDYVYTGFYRIDEEGNIIRYEKALPIENLLVNCCIGACFMYRRKVYEEIGEYDSTLYFSEDYDYWLRISKKFRMQHLEEKEPSYFYRERKNSLTDRYGLKGIEDQEERIKVRHIKSSLRHYYNAYRYLFRGDICIARKLLVNSLILNPFNLKAWRCLLSISLKPSQVVKKTKANRRRYFQPIK